MLSLTGYQLKEQLYESVRSLVYRAIREADECPVVLKLLNRTYPTPEDLARFRREYEITHKLGDIDGVIQVHHLKPHGNSLFIELEDFGADALNRHPGTQTLDIPGVLRLAVRMSEILSAVHHRHIMHKDVNPSNFVWNPDSGQLKLIDFGVSTELSREQPEIRNPNILEGTLAYMSPEQTGRMNRTMDYRTDLYSLGATLYYLLTSHPPFQAEDALEMVHCHLAKMPPPPGDLPTSAPSQEGNNTSFTDGHIPLLGGGRSGFPKVLSDIVMKLMAKNAEDRYQSAYGVKTDLEWCLANLTGLQDLSGFIPGKHDISERFEIPQKLYGREPEIDTLLAAFDRVTASQTELPVIKPEMLLVTGYAGIGKSALVNEIQKPIVAKRGYFLAGKFDQFQRNVPYLAFIQAFQSFVRQLLSEPEPQLLHWKNRLQNALGTNGRVLSAVMPELELILGTQPEIPELPPEQAKNRFNLVLRNFVEACATADHPIVFFLDDLQWADVPSLILLRHLLTDAAIRFMLIIGAYRDHDVQASHPLMAAVTELRNAGVQVGAIALAPLTYEAVNELLTETLHVPGNTRSAPSQEEEALTALLLRKTGGNPFFLRQFLLSLHEEHLIIFNRHSRRWKWDVERIQHADITENVVDLMIRKIRRLPAETQQAVQLASCIGSQFDLHTLAIVSEQSASRTLAHLWEALQEELVVVIGNQYSEGNDCCARDWDEELQPHESSLLNTDFTFLHDRVQQAAYSLIDDDRRKEIHLKIGQLMLKSTVGSDQRLEESIFDIVNHLNQGRETIGEQAAKEQLIALNLMVGKKAKTTAAYQPAFDYFKTGIQLLGEESWEHQYELTRVLYVEAMEAAFLSTNFSQMEELAHVVEEQAKTLLDKVKVYEVKAQAYIAQGKLKEAVRIALAVLKMLGVKFPSTPNKWDIMVSLLGTTLVLRGKHVEDLRELPAMTDPFQLAAMRIMSSIFAAAYIAVPTLMPLLICKQVKLSIHYGNNVVTAFSYANYGLILCGIVGDIEHGYRFGKLALQLVEKLNAKEFKTRTLFSVNTFITHFKEHLREALKPLLEAYQSGLETGDLEYAAWSLLAYSYTWYLTSSELITLEQEMASFSDTIKQLKQESTLRKNNLWRQAVLNLMNRGDDSTDASPCCLIGESYDEEKMLPVLHETNEVAETFQLYFNKLMLACLFQEYSQAIEHSKEAEKYLDAVPGTSFVPVFYFYDSLARLGVYLDLQKSRQHSILKKISANQKKMKKWSHHAPMNFLHKWDLVEAERARILGKDADAMNYYDKAIEGAKEYEYLHEEALANELAAKFYLARERKSIARIYMREARYCYLKWGAKAKVKHLDDMYPKLLAETEDTRRGERGVYLTDTSTSTDTSSTVLDLTSLMKASQAISGEIVLDNLLKRLLDIVMKNAGAERGMILFDENRQWIVKAMQGFQADTLEFPESMMTYVARTKAPVVSGNAVREGTFVRDAYILKHQSQSVLCLPLMNQGRLVAILFLENSLSPDVFTSERLEILKLLASQAAISIENALLYSGLEQRVAERTAELETARQTALEAQEAAEAANQAKSEFLSNMSHELRTPLNSILGYAHILKRSKSEDNPDYDGLAIIERSGTLLLNLINDLLDLSRIEAKQFDLHCTPIHLHECLTTITSMIRICAQKKGIPFHFEAACDLPTYIVGDEKRLQQILLNLLGNAVKFTDHGEVTLKVTQVEGGHPPAPLKEGTSSGDERKSPLEGGQGGVLLQFSISDTGPGIPEDRLEAIFSPFVQVGDHTSRRKGTGLGLAVSRQLAGIMGGSLSVESIEGQGSTFRVDIPFAVPLHPASPGPEEQNSKRICGYTGARRRILIADDDAQNRMMLADLLRPLGFTIKEAVDGQDALYQLEEMRPDVPDLLLLDLIMPCVDGIEVARRIRHLEEFQAIKIIAVSANVSFTEQEKLVDLGCDDFLPKPVHIQNLLERLRVHLELEWEYDSILEPAPAAQAIIFPSREDIAELITYAKGGYVTDMRKALDRLKQSDPELFPFSDRLKEMVNAFQFKQIIDFLMSALM